MNSGFQPSVCAIVGDNVDGKWTADLSDVQSWWPSLTTALSGLNSGIRRIYTSGNHDWDLLSESQYRTLITADSDVDYLETGRCYGSFDEGDYHFIVLDSFYDENDDHIAAQGFSGYDGVYVGATQRAWLTADLAATNKKTIIFNHMHLMPTFVGHWSYGLTYQSPDHAAVRYILEASGKVIAVFIGHKQYMETMVVQGIPYISMPSLSDANPFARFTTGPGFDGHWLEVTINDVKKEIKLEHYLNSNSLADGGTGNDFSGDGNVVALWDMEETSGNRDDSVNSMELVDNNTVLYGTGDYYYGEDIESSNAALFDSDNSEYLSITDANLHSDVPFKTGGDGIFSICFWYKKTTKSSFTGLVTKWDNTPSGGGKSFMLQDHAGILRFMIGYNSGEDTETLSSEYVFATRGWYHVAATFNDTTKAWTLRVWDDTSGSVVLNDSGTATNNMEITDTDFMVSGWLMNGTPSYFIDGMIDELVIFDDIIDTNQIDQIRNGSYYSAGTPVTPSQTNDNTGVKHTHYMYFDFDDDNGKASNPFTTFSDDPDSHTLEIPGFNSGDLGGVYLDGTATTMTFTATHSGEEQISGSEDAGLWFRSLTEVNGDTAGIGWTFNAKTGRAEFKFKIYPKQANKKFSLHLKDGGGGGIETDPPTSSTAGPYLFFDSDGEIKYANTSGVATSFSTPETFLFYSRNLLS
jgi:hypothetical protein